MKKALFWILRIVVVLLAWLISNAIFWIIFARSGGGQGFSAALATVFAYFVWGWFGKLRSAFGLNKEK